MDAEVQSPQTSKLHAACSSSSSTETTRRRWQWSVVTTYSLWCALLRPTGWTAQGAGAGTGTGTDTAGWIATIVHSTSGSEPMLDSMGVG